MNTNFPEGDDVLGCGVAHPLQLSGGAVGMRAFDAQVRQSIRLILETGEGERLMRPDFGGNLGRLAFEPMNAATLTHIEYQVRETLARFEPRIEVTSVKATPEEALGRVIVEMQYRVKRTDSVFNLVYPFYVQRGGA